jgi:transposase
MLELSRVQASDVKVRSIPEGPGVYAWFRSSAPIYAGKASGRGGLRERLGKHLGVGLDLSRSSRRRNVAEHLLSIPTSVSRQRPSAMTPEQVSEVNAWIQELELSWLEFPTRAESVAFERELLHEWMPPLSKR